MPELAIPPAPPQPPASANPAGPDLAGSEAFGALDLMSKDDGTPEPAAPEAPAAPEKPPVADKTPTRPKDEKTGKFIKPDAKTPPKPADKGKPATFDFDNPPGTIGDLRKHYDAIKEERKALLDERKSWESKHQELEKKLSESRDWPEKKSYEEKLSEREKRLQEYENHIRLTRYEKSQEYKEKYQTPYENAFMVGRQKAASLKVVERKNEEGQVLQAARQGKQEDFDEIFRIWDDDTAAEKAVQLFGEAKAAMMLIHRENAQRIRSEGLAKIEEMGKKGEEWEKQQTELQTKQFSEAKTQIEHFKKAAADKWPHLFKADDSDPKWNELLENGDHFLQRVLENGKPLNDKEQQWTPDQIAIGIATLHNKAKGYDPLLYRYNKTLAEVKELKKKLADFEQSEPQPGEGGRAATNGEPDADDPFVALDKMAKER
jgi:hypothetical protein